MVMPLSSIAYPVVCNLNALERELIEFQIFAIETQR